MVFTEAAQKTGAFMLLAAILGLGVLTFMTEDLSSPSGRVVTPATDVIGGNWLVFALGLFIGCLMIGTYFFISHSEARRKE